MVRQIIILLAIALSIIVFSCDEELVVIPKPCSEEPDLPFRSIDFNIMTDITSSSYVTVNKNGTFYGDNISIKRNGILKKAKISGYTCKDAHFTVYVVYKDTVDNSILKIEGGYSSNLITARIYYCSNFNNLCTFTDIGGVNASYSGTYGAGSFFTPRFDGEFEYHSR